MPIQVNHIADLSLANHFKASETDAPVRAQVKINKNVYDVSFANGRVSAKFLTGNAFTNFFRSKTLSRFTQTLQSQYTVWLDQQRRLAEAKAAREAKTLGFEDNPDAAKVQSVVDEFTAIVNEANPAGKEKFLARLGDILTLASLRNQMTANPSAAACNKLVTDAKFLTHFDDNTKGMDEKGKKGYLVNMLDALVGGFLAAASQMKDRKTEVVEFLRLFDGECVEAKNDNIQDWLSKAAGISTAAHSTETDDLAYSVTLEFAAIEEEVRAPYYEEERRACEAEVRAFCAKKGITDEAEIRKKIEAKAAMRVLDREDEIKPVLREKLERYGKFVAYGALVGAKRPVTSVDKNSEGKWVLTTLVDKTGAPVLKPVSAFDIDKLFPKLVDMYMDEAFAMGGMIERKTVTAEPVFATREDLRAEKVIETGALVQGGKVDFAQFAELVKKEFTFDPGIPDEEFQEHVKTALRDVMKTKKDNAAETEEYFRRLFNNFADASYFDAKTDAERLVNLVARRAEIIVNRKQAILSKIPAAAARCAMMMKNAYQKMNYKVYTAKAADYIQMALENAVKAVFDDKADPKRKQIANKVFDGLMPTGILFSDHPTYDLAHRAAGNDEVKLHRCFNLLRSGVRYLSGGKDDYYLEKLNA
jgi:hypothetical protein